jgi:hypothetical protein
MVLLFKTYKDTLFSLGTQAFTTNIYCNIFKLWDVKLVKKKVKVKLTG